MLTQVTVIWSAAAGASLLLGIVHALVWLYDRRARGNLAFAIAALGLAAASLLELELLHAGTAEQYGEILWWLHLPLSLLVIGMAIFMRLYLDAGRWWLLAALVGLRAAILVFNLFSAPNFNFERIDAIGHITFLGEQLAVVTSAVTGKYQWLAVLASFLFPLFLVDVVATLWRRGTTEARRRALVVGGPVLVSVVLSWVLTQLVIWRVVVLPILLTPPFFIALAAMALEVSRDVIRAARLSRELRESEQRLELAANAAGAGLWAWDSTSGRVWATERTRSIMCLDPAADIQLADVLRVVDPVDARELNCVVNEAVQHGGEHALQFRILPPQGPARWIAAQGTVELGAGDKPGLVRGVVRDVTQQHRAEEEASELRRKLAHAGRVTILGQLAAALAHEISQPLSAIQQNGETMQLMVARSPLDPAQLREVIDDIVRDNRRAGEVVQRLRSWLKQGHMQPETIRLDTLARDVLALVRSEASAKHVMLECNVPGTLPPVHADRVHLSQVLINLIMNAIDASAHARGAGRGRVSITASFNAASGCCEVCVSDTGPGIPPDQLNRVFDPFFTSKREGMGIGLSISRTIVETHGGKLWAENEPGGGAIFRFTVPLEAGEVRVPARSSIPS
jgi:two-component system, LuxR family, sensor kinase FixL